MVVLGLHLPLASRGLWKKILLLKLPQWQVWSGTRLNLVEHCVSLLNVLVVWPALTGVFWFPLFHGSNMAVKLFVWTMVNTVKYIHSFLYLKITVWAAGSVGKSTSCASMRIWVQILSIYVKCHMWPQCPVGRDRRVNGVSQPVFISIERPRLQGVRYGVTEQEGHLPFLSCLCVWTYTPALHNTTLLF